MKDFLHELVDEGFLIRKGKRYQYNDAGDGIISGKIQIKDDGNYGFVIPQNSNNKDIFVSERNLGTAFHDDLVEGGVNEWTIKLEARTKPYKNRLKNKKFHFYFKK